MPERYPVSYRGESPLIGYVDVCASINQQLSAVVPSVGAGVVQVGVAGGVGAVGIQAFAQQEGGHTRRPVHHRVRQCRALVPARGSGKEWTLGGVKLKRPFAEGFTYLSFLVALA